jgi:hypothetical protein
MFVLHNGDKNSPQITIQATMLMENNNLSNATKPELLTTQLKNGNKILMTTTSSNTTAITNNDDNTKDNHNDDN